MGSSWLGWDGRSVEEFAGKAMAGVGEGDEATEI